MDWRQLLSYHFSTSIQSRRRSAFLRDMTAASTVRVHHSITEISEASWNRCASPFGAPSSPFIDHRFLLALEKSGCVSGGTGWLPFHIALIEDDKLVGALPMYLKSHSYGEYVFDHEWARALASVGGNYYPKFQVGVPFTPVTGPRFLVSEASRLDDLRRKLLQSALLVARTADVSSLHCTFLEEAEWNAAGGLGFLKRTDTQFHWQNEDYSTFDEFLGSLSSRKRKNIRRERREAVQAGVSIERLRGGDLDQRHWDALYSFYIDTGNRKWGIPYLSREFFGLIAEWMADEVLLVMCKRAGKYIAGAIHFIGAESLYGRYWGCIEHHPFLHFETCYYQAIEFAIEHGMRTVEAGAGGGHKLARGYVAKPTYSVHWLRNPELRKAVSRFLGEERGWIQQDMELIESHSPYKRTRGAPPKGAHSDAAISNRTTMEAETASEKHDDH